jgi:hypothetical protein
VVLLLIVLAAAPSLTAFAEEASTPAAAFPYGRYDGSVIGVGLDREGKPKVPIAVKVWLSEGDEGAVKITVSTPALPFSVDTNPATPQRVDGGWDLAVSGAYGSGKTSIRGSGTLRLRQRADGWYAWGSGTGSVLGGQEGSGYGSAKRVVEESSVVDQFLSPITDTFGSFGDSGPVPPPEEYPAAEFSEVPAETPAEVSADVAAPAVTTRAQAEAVVLIWVLILFILEYGASIGIERFLYQVITGDPMPEGGLA